MVELERIALDHGKAGVRAYTFSPGVIGTDMRTVIARSGFAPDGSRSAKEALPPPREAALLVAALCADDEGRFAGQAVDVNTEELRRFAAL